MGYIYMLRNKVNGKIYIGQTIRPIHKRLKEHETGTTDRCRAIYNAIQKYGWDNFEKDYYECPDEDLNFDEEILMREMGTLAPGGYNLREGGGSRGKHSEESKQKYREARLGKKHSDEHKRKISEAQAGEKNHMWGKPHTEESIRKISKATTGGKNHNSKRVYQYDLDGTFINSFESCGEAERIFRGKDGTNISSCARGKYNTAYGFKWSYTKL
jgi:group I intron endonuclease